MNSLVIQKLQQAKHFCYTYLFSDFKTNSFWLGAIDPFLKAA